MDNQNKLTETQVIAFCIETIYNQWGPEVAGDLLKQCGLDRMGWTSNTQTEAQNKKQ